ncbi:adhesion G-protein coupled receptor G6-like [Antedon mediterranea]|uniref:adhesion G-protein coupled receptor G6-like n=1 Tax=Antedon mediterranea TaxID=105859 RepID=UPI003AF62F0C
MPYSRWPDNLLWSKSGSQGDVWHNASVKFVQTESGYVDNYIVFEGISGNSFTGDIAIDDIYISDGSPVTTMEPPVSDSTSFLTDVVDLQSTENDRSPPSNNDTPTKNTRSAKPTTSDMLSTWLSNTRIEYYNVTINTTEEPIIPELLTSLLSYTSLEYYNVTTNTTEEPITPELLTSLLSYTSLEYYNVTTNTTEEPITPELMTSLLSYTLLEYYNVTINTTAGEPFTTLRSFTTQSAATTSPDLLTTKAPPTIKCPSDISSTDTTPDWLIPIAKADETPPPPVYCSNKPGDSYPIGSVTTVTCNTTDVAGQQEMCSFYITIETDLSEEINNLTKNVGEDNVEKVAVELEEIVEKAEDVGDLQPADIQEVSVALETITDIESTNENVTDAIVSIVDAVLVASDSEDTVLTPATTSVILESFEQQISTAATNGQNYTQNEETLSVQTLSFDSDNLRHDVVFAVKQDKKETEVCIDGGCSANDQSITLPRDLVSNDKKSNVSFTSYYNSKLFQSSSSGNLSISSVILSATVYDDSLPPVFEEPVKIVFNIKKAYEDVSCVFWNATLNGFGDWSEDGCMLVGMDDDGSITCHCTHLTNFAVLFFPNTLKSKVVLVLDIVTYVGCGVSILCLLITIYVSLSKKTFRKLQPQKILLNLCISLTCLYITFICGIDTATPGTVACTTIAVLLHYFLLTSVAWTSVEATNMYLLLVKVVDANTSNLLRRSVILAWGLPLIPLVVLLSVDVSFYKNTNYCYLNTHESNVFIYAVITPIAIAMACNFIIYICILRSLYCSSYNVQEKCTTLKEKKKRVSNAIAISLLLGLTWIFGFLSFESEADHVFLILFCVFNSLQGVAIFYLFTFRKRRKKWKTTLNESLNKDLKKYFAKKKATKTTDESVTELITSTTDMNTTYTIEATYNTMCVVEETTEGENPAIGLDDDGRDEEHEV